MNCCGAARLLAELLIGGGTAAATVVSIPYILSALGFSAVGVATGSLAAWCQSVFYGGSITTGSLFAFFQSMGAAGLPIVYNLGIGAGAGGFSRFFYGEHTVESLTKLLTNTFCQSDCDSNRL
ncbi:interferon alpha-inducible protein 27-like protein 1 [Limulus polyphemus]|uniref:Interferon alpha-inducible protein 27-like protein 1 n=1 Tax=Limulus polyphemus TaxID=6850 RepID=A0ABM1BYX6_LIMPO|nr:interferon alpha-inducible protein 27-like protein 1 [Limulus polyphemus]